MDADAEPVILALIKAAKGGDTAATRMVLERVAPLPRNRPVQFSMPAIERFGPGTGRYFTGRQ